MQVYLYIYTLFFTKFFINMKLNDDQSFVVKGKWCNKNELPCGYTPVMGELKKMVILPSTMWFTKKLCLTSQDIVELNRGTYRVCYSFHSSYTEVRDLVTYLKPKRIRPNVKPKDDADLYQVRPFQTPLPPSDFFSSIQYYGWRRRKSPL